MVSEYIIDVADDMQMLSRPKFNHLLVILNWARIMFGLLLLIVKIGSAIICYVAPDTTDKHH